jgi:hypothetical protein
MSIGGVRVAGIKVEVSMGVGETAVRTGVPAVVELVETVRIGVTAGAQAASSRVKGMNQSILRMGLLLGAEKQFL